MVSSNVSSRSREGFRRPSDREDIVYLDRGQLGLDPVCASFSAHAVVPFVTVHRGALLSAEQVVVFSVPLQTFDALQLMDAAQATPADQHQS
jgi:hypothetical protein